MPKSKALKPYLLGNLNFLNSQGKIWLNPSYQREAVWTKSQKQLLIDSIFRDIDIPKIYFREISDVNDYEFEVVDGQQRLRSVFDFMNNEVKMPGDSDDVDGMKIAGLKFSNLHTTLQMKFQNTQFDVVIYNKEYTDSDIEETFLRMQNGTSLNAAEKRRAIQGNLREIVAKLAKHKVFKLCSFSNSRFAYEDATAKVLHQMLAGTITDIRPASIVRTYKTYTSIGTDHKEVKRLQAAYNFIHKAFDKKPSPGLKKYAVISLGLLVADLLETYSLSKHPTEFAQTYLDFDSRRIENEEKAEEDQDPILSAYTDAARSDSLQDMRYRYETLRLEIVSNIPSLTLKDPSRSFTNEQRMAIYRKYQGKCQRKGCKTICDEAEFHADHIVAHSKGGKTTVANGQVLCPAHNLSKGDRET